MNLYCLVLPSQPTNTSLILHRGLMGILNTCHCSERVKFWPSIAIWNFDNRTFVFLGCRICRYRRRCRCRRCRRQSLSIRTPPLPTIRQLMMLWRQFLAEVGPAHHTPSSMLGPTPLCPRGTEAILTPCSISRRRCVRSFRKHETTRCRRENAPSCSWPEN